MGAAAAAGRVAAGAGAGRPGPLLSLLLSLLSLLSLLYCYCRSCLFPLRLLRTLYAKRHAAAGPDGLAAAASGAGAGGDRRTVYVRGCMRMYV